jgi:hypothetical protein
VENMAETHIEQCQACGGNISALHRPSYVRDHAGCYYHNKPDCVPHVDALRLEFQAGNGLLSR